MESFFHTRYVLNKYSGACKCEGTHNSARKHDDPKRLRLDEPLSSMSAPDRYRHVGLQVAVLHNYKILQLDTKPEKCLSAAMCIEGLHREKYFSNSTHPFNRYQEVKLRCLGLEIRAESSFASLILISNAFVKYLARLKIFEIV